MEYKQFVVQAFEQEPGKWRARIRRIDGAPIVVTGRKKQGEFVTGLDAKTAPAAMLMAMAAIDAGTFSLLRRVTEKFWRFQGPASGSRSDRDVPQISLRPTRSKWPQPGRNERKLPSPKS